MKFKLEKVESIEFSYFLLRLFIESISIYYKTIGVSDVGKINIPIIIKALSNYHMVTIFNKRISFM